ncbi:MAG: adenosylmethionine decarboxylase [Gammaproteobacteria bacterium]
MKELPDHFKTDQRGTAYAGDHMLIELWDAHNLTDAGLIEQTLTRAARAAEATVLHAYYHPFGEGQGVSGVTVLAESHISIHTWPERGYAAIDVFMCGDCDPNRTLPEIERAFMPGRIETRLFKRGVVSKEQIKSVA